MVGHSFGGVFVRAFAADYPDEVVGMVLVDSSHENQLQQAPLEIEEISKLQVEAGLTNLRINQIAERLGLIRAFKLLDPAVNNLHLAENDEKAKLLESVSQLEEQQTVLADRFKSVIEEFKQKGGKVDDYEAYIAAISGIDLKLGAVRTNWALVSGWLTSTEGGLRWAKKYFTFFSYRSGFMDSGCFDQQSR